MHTPGKSTKRTIIAVTAILATTLLAACGGGSSGSANKDTTKATGNITFWSWTPGLDPIIKTFENSHPGITVTVVNAGQGAAEYAKLRTAVKAGSGAPDVAAIEYQYIPTFVNDLVDLNQYGAADLKSKYVDWAWAQAGQNGKQLGMPWDTAPMCIVYRADIFEQYGIQVPKTWDEFAAAARRLHAAAPNVYLTNLAANDPGQFLSMTAQAGSRPYKVDSAIRLTLALNDAGAKQWANFWTPLVKDGVVSTDSAWNDNWYKGLADGRYASWITAAWGPVFLQGQVKETSGKWRVMPLPQWTAGGNVSAAWGGSTFAVLKQSKKTAAAAEFAKWMSSSQEATSFTANNLFGFPATTSILDDPTYLNAKSDFFGGQQIGPVYVESTKGIDSSFQYSPFQDYVYSQMQTLLGKALSDKSDLASAFDELQTTVSTYATSQGFEVSK